MIQVKPVYDPPQCADGARYLVERLWPRGMSKESAALTGWLKEVAPSTTRNAGRNFRSVTGRN